MRKILLILLFFLMFFSSMSFSKVPEFSAGIFAGSNSGFSIMYRYEKDFAFTMFSGWTFLGTNGFNVNANLVWLNDRALQVGNSFLTVYAGGGIKLLNWNEIGFRVPLGVIYPFQVNNNRNRIDVFIEAAPCVYTILNGSSFIGVNTSIGIGARYVF